MPASKEPAWVGLPSANARELRGCSVAAVSVADS